MRANYLRLLTTSEGVYQYTVTYRCGRGGEVGGGMLGCWECCGWQVLRVSWNLH